MSEIKDIDQGVVERVLSGDGAAVRKLYAYLSPRLRRVFATKVVHSEDVDELIQDTFLHLLDALPLFRYQSHIVTFAISIARHELSDYWRKQYAKRFIRTTPIVIDVPSTLYSRAFVSERISLALENAYQQIKPLHAQLLRWKYEEGKSVKEMALLLGVTNKAVEALLYRSRKSFQLAYIEPDFY